MARPGGNPQLQEYQYSTTRSEALCKQLTIRVGKTMEQLLRDKKIENWQEVARVALAKALKDKGYDVPDY